MAKATVAVPKGRRFLDKFGALEDIFMPAPLGGVKRPFHIINDKIMDGDMDALVQQQRDAIPAKQISNVEWEAIKADRMKKGEFPPHHDNILGQGGFGIVYQMRGWPTQARKVANINATGSIAHEIDILKQLRGSEFVIQSLSDKPEPVKARVTVVNERLHTKTVKEITADSYVMPLYSQCKNLHDVLYLNEPIPHSEKFFTRVLGDIFLGLEFIHSKNIVHNDLKPCNILVRSDGRALIIDFGMATMFNTPIDWLGTPEWSSPEQLLYFAESFPGHAHRSSPADDIFSFGLICQAVYDRDTTVDRALAHLLQETGLCTTLGAACNKILHDRKESPLYNYPKLLLELYDSPTFLIRLTSDNPKNELPFLTNSIRRMLEPVRDKRITLAELEKLQFFQTALSRSRPQTVQSEQIRKLNKTLSEVVANKEQIVKVHFYFKLI